MHFVDIVAGGFPCLTVDRHPVPHLVLDNQHTDFLELFSQLLDVVGHDTAVNIHVGTVVEYIEGPGNIDFQSGCDIVGFFFLLFQKLVVQVLQNGHLFGNGVSQIVPVHQSHTTVDDRLFDRLQALLAADDKLTQREDKVRFQRQRIFVVRIVEVQIHGIDIVRRGRRNADNLSVQTLHQGTVLGFGVADDNIIIGYEKHIGNLTLCREGLTAARCAENQAVRVLQLLSVYHNEVVGKSVNAAVQRFVAGLE